MLTTPDVSDIELKQRWRLYWLQTIFEFSHISLQNLAWIEKKAVWSDGEPWDSSFEQCMSAYFDDLALDDAYEKAVAWGNVSQEEAHESKRFHQLAVFYDEPSSDPSEIIQDPEWLEVVEAANVYWEYLKAHIDTPREVDLIQKLEKAFG